MIVGSRARVWLAALITMIAAACGGGGDGSAGERFQGEPESDFVSPARSKPSEGEASLVRFRDDFSDPASGWDVVDGADFQTEYGGGRFRVVVKKAHLYGITSTLYEGPKHRPEFRELGDIAVEISATAEQAADGAVGLVCRTQGQLKAQEHYGATVGADGRWLISRTRDQKPLVLTQGETGGPAFGSAPVRLRLECIGQPGQPARVRFYADGQVLGELDDPTSLEPGGAGFIVASRGMPGVVALLDDFVIALP